MKRFVTVIMSAVLMLPLTACGNADDGAGGTFYAAINANPQNLDPQMSSDSNSLSVIGNVFDGLVRIDENGAVQCAAAENYSVSSDGLTYTFQLRKGMKWSSANGFSADVTADDFVYSFRRIFDPDMLSPYTDMFACLKNSDKVYKGTMSVADLGVKAQDEYTVVFTLEYPVSNFLYLLASPAAVPCNEEFFLAANGRYGLAAEYCAGNGAFTLTEWNYDPYWNENFLALKRNSANSSEEYRTYPSYVNYIITSDTAEYEKSSGNTFDCAVYSPEELPKLRGKNSYEYQCAAVGLTFSKNNAMFLNNNIRYALCAASDVSAYSGKTSEGITPARGIFPHSVSAAGKSLREAVSENSKPVYSEADAITAWQRGVAETNADLNEPVSIIVSEDFADASEIYRTTNQWNDVLGFSCGIEILSDSDYSDRIESGDYDIALAEVKSSRNNAADFLRCFEDYIYDTEINRQLEICIEDAERSTSAAEIVASYDKAENLVISCGYFIPMFYESRFLVTPSDTEGIVYDPFAETLYFKNAKKFN